MTITRDGITRDVINDLLPSYFSGEASADTSKLVEEYFFTHPSFEEEARAHARDLDNLSQIRTTPPTATAEKQVLKRAKRVLMWQKILLALASTFTLNAISLGFSIEVGDGQFRVHWLALPGQRQLIAAIFLASAFFWILYFRIGRRVRKNILG